MTVDNLLTIREVGENLRIGKTTAYEMVKAGIIKSIRIGKGRGGIRIPTSCLEEFVQSQLQPKPAEPQAPKRRGRPPKKPHDKLLINFD